MENTNEMTIIFDSYSSNEAFARAAVAATLGAEPIPASLLNNPRLMPCGCCIYDIAESDSGGSSRCKDCGIRGCNQCDHPRIRKPDREDHASL